MVWLIMKITRPNGLALFRILSYKINEIYAKQVARRVNIYAIPCDDPNTVISTLKIYGGTFEVLAIADELQLGDGWEVAEVVTKKFVNDWGWVVNMKFIRYKGKEYPVGRVRPDWKEASEAELEESEEEFS